MVCIIGTIGDDVLGFEASNQFLTIKNVAAMAWSCDDANWQAQGVGGKMEL